MLAVVDFGQIISRQVRQTTPLGAVCMHVSLLPELRGAAPVNWAIIRGLARTGVTTFRVVREIDAGPIFLQEALEIGPEETAEELRGRLAVLGGALLVRTTEGLAAAGTLEAYEQDHAAATMAPKLEKADGRLDFAQSAATLANRIRGTWPWPGAHADFIHAGGSKSVRVILARARAHAGGGGATPGTLGPDLRINTADGAIELLELQVAGKRLMTWRDFVNGYRAAAGDRFATVQE
jgi:methionyl-tRNA formyltransferase